ncbi:MAG: glycosyltransferase 87 family protein [Oscillospiraceae bacterium]|nr:glycosyltransferase 87 family protein [Oscillospiraceae bacterium]
MKQYALTRVPMACLLAAGLFPLLRIVSPIPERGEAAVMAAAFALLAGGVLWFAARDIKASPILFFFAALLAAGMIVRTLSLTQGNNTDYIYCLKPWAEEFRAGGWGAIVTTWSDYNMPYLYVIGAIARVPMDDLYLYKLVSVIFDCAIVVAGLRLGRIFALSGLRKAVLGGAMFLAPTVWLNSAFWAQCDSIYVFFCLLSFVLILEDRPALSAAMIAVAFTFKLQTIFFMPIFIVLWILKRVVWWREIPVFIGTFFAAVLPAWLLGRPLQSIVSVYATQTSQYSSRLNLNSPSAYALLGHDTSHLPEQAHDILFYAGVILAFCFLGALLLLAWLNRHTIGKRSLLLFVLAMVIGIPWLLPSMHDRYFYLADIFCIFIAVLIPEKWHFAPFCIVASYSGYHAFLFGSYVFWTGHQIPGLLMLFLMGGAVALLIGELKSERGETPLLEEDILEHG